MTERLIALGALCVFAGAPLGLVIWLDSRALLGFVFAYSLLMSCLWMAGGLYFWWHWERHWSWRPEPAPDLPGNPLVSILVPCFNEEQDGAQALLAALGQNYANLEVIAINDGSTDGTAAMLDDLAAQHPKLRVIHLAQNQGKAMALRMGAMAARSDFLVSIDGDACLAEDAVRYLVAPLMSHQRVAAVTGNPRIRTRSTLLGRLQVGEFSSIVGLIKRTQRVYGQLFTVSGVCTAFRRDALDQVNYWSLDMITEDIDITWKLQLAHWRVFYEPRALCWILMPETLRGLWKQRLRWARGGALEERTPLEQFNDTLERAILSRMASAVSSKIIGSDGNFIPGRLETDNFTIDVADVGDGVLTITTIDKLMGGSTTFQVSK